MIRRWGLDYKAAGKFEQVILDEHPAGWGAGGFVEVDGWPSSIPTFDRLLATGRCPWLRLELCWDDQHNYTAEHNGTIERNARAAAKLIEKYPAVEFYICPVTEHRLTQERWQLFANIVNNVLQGLRYQLVNSPLRDGFVHKTLINESHGGIMKPRGARYAFSHDGENAVDGDMEGYKKNYADAEYFLIWNCQMNGNRVLVEKDEKGNVIKTPRNKRKFYPVGKQIDSYIFLKSRRGDVKLPGGWTLKSHSDQHDVPPKGKDQKPVIITPPREKYSEIVFKARNGQVIDRARYFGPLNDKRTGKITGHRYYCTDWGFILALKALRIAKSPVVQIWVNGKRVGRCNLGFRGGTFR